ncbi:hypothetical protein [Sphingobacterium sp. NPDC055346]
MRTFKTQDNHHNIDLQFLDLRSRMTGSAFFFCHAEERSISEKCELSKSKTTIITLTYSFLTFGQG